MVMGIGLYRSDYGTRVMGIGLYDYRVMGLWLGFIYVPGCAVAGIFKYETVACARPLFY